MKILFLVPYPKDESPSQRYRFEHYLPHLEKQGIQYRLESFLTLKGWTIIFRKGHIAAKTWVVVMGFFRRWILLFKIRSFDFVYIHREAAPAGPPIFEWLIANVFKRRIIYDFDDAIWLPVTSRQNRFAKYIRWFSKVKTICRLSYKVSTGNSFLASYAGQFCNNTVVIPTVVNTESIHNQLKDHASGKLTVGWTGTFSTLPYLDPVIPVIEKLQQQYDFEFIVIANKDPDFKLKHYRFIRWSKENEISDLLNFHIGIMPLRDGELEKGKCGFKAIQYLSLGIPAVVSPVGVNTEIVQHGASGFLASDLSEWEFYIEKLLTNPQLRTAAGIKGRKEIIEKYSVIATVYPFLKLFES